ncbi:MAG: hypothetical protein FH758_08180 [Firmicutes bacterium]|nr:hypothetical protein [Bacillota bacterium]
MKSFNKDLDRFYEILDMLRQRVGGYRYLRSCTGRMDWPKQGVYFFFEPGETRVSSDAVRVVRVGTHAVSEGSKTTLWNRLITHRGTTSGTGNHRGSIFRLHVGTALLATGEYPHTVRGSWGKGSSAPKEVKLVESGLEQKVSKYIGSMPFLWVRVEDVAGKNSLRKYIERNAVALLSNVVNKKQDQPSANWLGHHCLHQDVQLSGLWNVDHVYEDYDPDFLVVFKDLAEKM